MISRGAARGDRQIAVVNRLALGAFIAYLAAGAGYMIYQFGWDGAWKSIACVAIICALGGLIAKFAAKSEAFQHERYQRIAGPLSMVSFSIVLAAVLLGGVSHYISNI